MLRHTPGPEAVIFPEITFTGGTELRGGHFLAMLQAVLYFHWTEKQNISI